MEKTMDKFLLNIDKVPESYKKYYNETENNRNVKIDLELDEEHLNYIHNMAKNNEVDLNLYMNYILMKLIIKEKTKTEKYFNVGISEFDFELFDDIELDELFKNNVLIFDSKANKKAVMIPSEEYEKLQECETKYISKIINDNCNTKIFLKIDNEDNDYGKEDLSYYEMLLENLEKVQS